jgi:hypothetical protein
LFEKAFYRFVAMKNFSRKRIRVFVVFQRLGLRHNLIFIQPQPNIEYDCNSAIADPHHPYFSHHQFV